jgi:perosamine synthetase
MDRRAGAGMIGSPPRYRIYGGARNYAQTVSEMIRGQWHKGNAVDVLESTMRESFGVSHALAVPMARVGIYLAIKNLIRPGQKVLLSPYTIADVVNMVIAAGGRPSFIDVDLASGNMCPAELEKNLSGDVGAILITHLHGISAEVEKIVSIAKRAGLPVIEDCAQSLGASIDGKRLGTFGDVGVFSFGTYKNINSWFGGLVVTNDSELARKIRRSMSDWKDFSSARVREKMRFSMGMTFLVTDPLFNFAVRPVFRYGYLHDVTRINRAVAIELDTSRKDILPEHYQSKLSAGQARRVLEQWPLLDSQTQARIKFARRYAENLSSSNGLRLPPPPRESRHVYTYFPLQADRRTNLLKWLMYFGRDLAAQHLKNCAHLESFKEFRAECPNAERVAKSVLLLPTYPSYGIDQVDRNVEVVNWYIEAAQPEFDLVKAKKLSTTNLFFAPPQNQ